MIEFACTDQVAVATLAQPARGNALSESMVENLIAWITESVADESIHTLVLTSTGSHFCTGFDLGTQPTDTCDEGVVSRAASDGPLLWRFARIEHLLSLLWNAPLRTVAVARGRTWGAGADLFAACDLRYASAQTEWRFPGAGFGLVLGTRRLASLVGQARAMDWVAHGRRIDSGDAISAGLATALVNEPDHWQEQLPKLAVDRSTYAQLKAATRPDLGQADLAALVRSAALPGLADRLEKYKNSSKPRK
ncbi:enoyl-CoA hydratase/isomerase family protein [Ottowia thiooxydans]|uniref:enoyl-CoA hydratase/isomerase family protein n=1 Tax=Ottowia thiooxydans TaxID=219182 RepID=UPI000428F70B|nr:enoyl-CoA hydratase/isomerase family protein [Ottowia thiooxydans]